MPLDVQGQPRGQWSPEVGCGALGVAALLGLDGKGHALGHAVGLADGNDPAGRRPAQKL